MIKNVLVLIFLFLYLNRAQGSESLETKQIHYSSLFARQEALNGSYRDTYLALTDIKNQEALQAWYRVYMKNEKQARDYDSAMKKIKSWILGQEYRQLLYYFTVTGQVQQAGKTLGLYVLSSHSLLDNFVHDPQSVNVDAKAVKSIKSQLPFLDIEKIDQVRDCYTEYLRSKNVERGFSSTYSGFVKKGIKKCGKKNPYVTGLNDSLEFLFKHRNYPGAPFPTSFSGYVGGNEVLLHDRTPMAPENILLLGEQLSLIQKANVPGRSLTYADLSVEDYKSMMDSPQDALTNFFSTEEGFLNILDIEFNEMGFDGKGHYHGHPSFQDIQGQPGIFAHMIQSIRNAKESVFVDIFWMGGTIGMNLAKELMKKTIEDPDFTVVVLTDNENKFQYGTQLDIIYRFMKAYSEKFTFYNGRPVNFYMLAADVGRKRTALPEFVDLLVTDSVLNRLHNNESIQSKLEKDGFYLLAKSDHSKVMIMDGKNPETGVAYVGSKNWTDASGGANYDQMAEIKGPATSLILDAFYYDALEAFELESRENYDGEVVINHWKSKYPNLGKRAAIEKLLAPIDVLDRYKGKHFDVPYFSRGDTTVAPAQNNIYGTEISPVDQNIQAILSAKHQILIDDQFLYDSKIVEALLVAKKKHGVEIYVILEALSSYDPQASKVGDHLPNNLFIPELVAAGIQVKWHKPASALVEAILEDSAHHPGQQISATFHVKSLSVDGVLHFNSSTCHSGEVKTPEGLSPMLITGSANKDVMTMSGGFRESQVAVYSAEAVIQHDCLFWSRWNDSESTRVTDGWDFDLPPFASELGIKDKSVFLNTIRQVFFSTYNFTKDFF